MARVEDGYREIARGWKTVLRELKPRGLSPAGGVGSGAAGGAPAREVWPEDRAPGCWSYKLVKVLDKLGHLDGRRMSPHNRPRAVLVTA
jgi:hypothetical protein